MNKEIYFAGGCFWGIQELFSRVPGVLRTEAGYAQSQVPEPSYEQVCGRATGAVEAVKIVYDPDIASAGELAEYLFMAIDPTSVNRQGNDVGTQYRTGVYYTDPDQLDEIRPLFQREEKRLGASLAVELMPLNNFYPAEEYHQDYLKKHPGGYCHINLDRIAIRPTAAKKPSSAELRARLSPEAYHVTQENGTEPPFSGKYNNFDEPGIYVDVVSGEPLFLSTDKFNSTCGWPSFSAPATSGAIREKTDLSHGMRRIEARSAGADSHLGHVFNDGPKSRGGLRYCINSAALRFVPMREMERQGYGEFLPRLENDAGQ